MNKINALYRKMVEFYREDPARIQHFVKVHSFAKLIGEEEGLDERTLFILETAALVHDIGIRLAIEKYGSCAGHLQEQEGPSEAKRMLQELGFERDVTERVAYLVGHHHTYTNIEGMDYQILVEADFLVNLQEEHSSMETCRTVGQKIFRTETGKRLLTEIYDL